MAKRTSEEAGLADISKDSGNLSEVFNSEDSDIELLSKSGHRFLVHKANLASGSRVFADMFLIASHSSNNSIGTRASTSRREVLEMIETTKVLDKILPYLYPVRIAPFMDPIRHTYDIIAAFDKFEICRGIDAVESTLRNCIDRGSSAKSFLAWFHIYLFFSHFEVSDREILQRKIRLYLLESLAKEVDQVKRLMEVRSSILPAFISSSVDIDALVFWIQCRIMAIAKTYRAQTAIFMREADDDEAEAEIDPEDWAKLAHFYTARSLDIKLQSLEGSKTRALIFISLIEIQEAKDGGPAPEVTII